MNVLSTYNGMGCIWLALDKLGIKVKKRYSSEIDKHACAINDKNYEDTIQLGDVTKIKSEDLEKIDLVVGGSPCQGFSFAGKQLNFGDPRSVLFFEFVRLVGECKKLNPNVKFLLENVKMKQEYQDIISTCLGVEPIEINSTLMSAQSRKRLYWTNIEGVKKPEDKGVELCSILESGDVDRDKSYCIDANYFKGGKIGGTHQSSKRNYTIRVGTIGNGGQGGREGKQCVGQDPREVPHLPGGTFGNARGTRIHPGRIHKLSVLNRPPNDPPSLQRGL